jgi:hypothetical protein
VSFQLQQLGPNGSALGSLDVLSLDADASRGEDLSEIDWRHDGALRERVRDRGALYHFFSARVEGSPSDVSFVSDATAWALSRSGLSVSARSSVVAA